MTPPLMALATSPAIVLALEVLRDLVETVDSAIQEEWTHDELIKALKPAAEKFSTAISALDEAHRQTVEEANAILEKAQAEQKGDASK